MALKYPNSMNDCAYFTRRLVGDQKIVTWVFKEICPQCKKGIMGKPKDPKTGKPKIRAKEYTCPECGHTVEQEAYEDTLTANIQYTCGKCKNEGEAQVPFARKKVKIFNVEKQKDVTADAITFNCSKCKERIAVTKKMK